MTKKYNTIVIDPAWNISMMGHRQRRPTNPKKLPYKTMMLKDIENFPIKDFANMGSHIYLWTTNKFLRKSFEIFDKWGVNFHLVMVGIKPSGIAPNYGYVFGTEFVLVGFYGKPAQKWQNIGKLNWFKIFNKAGGHSVKPKEFYQLVRGMSPEPRIDIFSRRCIAGFDAWGDEAPKEKQLEIINTKEH